MRIDILTLFPGLFQNFMAESMISIALKAKALSLRIVNIRDYTQDRHRTADDYPYGGGAGMIMKPEPLYEAITSCLGETKKPVIYFTPQGRLLKQEIVWNYSQEKELILLCGHYKEIDQRIRDTLVTDELSIGDYVLSGGEIPAMVFIDALARLLPGVLNDIDSALTDSHQNGLLGSPHYTRPPDFMGLKVPEVLLSGNHQNIDLWRQEKSVEITRRNRPDLYRAWKRKKQSE
ncbi:MAG: tRNA (guanosine(37)-N1)-methyltransferase TrmD [Candidatus Cloacimonetes bacterium]|nr:tRNA (guanosine(37)-N1)-methyltransferase TrmD [Candidatus Cloacimonadota bacterium]